MLKYLLCDCVVLMEIAFGSHYCMSDPTPFGIYKSVWQFLACHCALNSFDVVCFNHILTLDAVESRAMFEQLRRLPVHYDVRVALSLVVDLKYGVDRPVGNYLYIVSDAEWGVGASSVEVDHGYEMSGLNLWGKALGSCE